ncbi:hypothetical protein MVES_002402 [Malassezia vespertilionis]|uniref:Uncharacterized protein n=1 Tax=Malassezia vespertilionis TaxID=2020962 RepID=A0A2N1JA88_9BASI|nr:hypothetical protein MVES_002402 [Malassezia vespertilionis]
MEPATHAELPTLKILLIGSSNVGKSALVLRFTKDAFLGAEDASATIGVDYQIKSICVQGKWFKLSIWDTAGQERYRTLTSSYYRGAQGVVLGRFEEMLTPVYDVTNTESFDALPSWLKELDTFSDEVKPVILLAGNKVDEASARVISTEQGEAFAKAHGCLFAECSAKEAVGGDYFA